MSAEPLTPVVVDASLVIKWLLPEPDSAAALECRRRWAAHHTVPVAPDFLLIEVHNAFWKKLLKGELTPDAPILAFVPTFGLEVNWFPFEPLLPQAWRLACQCQISVYDALYAALALQLNTALYTADVEFARRLGQTVTVHLLTPRAPRRSSRQSS